MTHKALKEGVLDSPRSLGLWEGNTVSSMLGKLCPMFGKIMALTQKNHNKAPDHRKLRQTQKLPPRAGLALNISAPAVNQSQALQDSSECVCLPAHLGPKAQPGSCSNIKKC